MSQIPHPLVEHDGIVFETTELCRVWSLGDPYLGVEVEKTGHKLDELTVRFYFVLPPLCAADGVVTLFTLARGLPGEARSGATEPGDGAHQMPRFWDPVVLRKDFGGVYAHVTYEPCQGRFSVLMNVGGESPSLHGVTLEGAFPDQVCGRVLECYFEIDKKRIFASVSDRFAGGDLAWDAVGPTTGCFHEAHGNEAQVNEHPGPWGKSPEGFWWLTSGVGDTLDPKFGILSPGFGISDLRVTFDSEIDQAVGCLPYRGALDHLVRHRRRQLSEQDILSFLRDIDDIRRIADNLDQFSQRLPATSSSSGLGATGARK